MDNIINKKNIIIAAICVISVIAIAIVSTIVVQNKQGKQKNELSTGAIEGPTAPKVIGAENGEQNSAEYEIGSDDEVITDGSNKESNETEGTNNIDNSNESTESDNENSIQHEVNTNLPPIKNSPIQSTNTQIPVVKNGKITLETESKLIEIMNFLTVNIINSGFEDIIKYSENKTNASGDNINIESALKRLELSMEYKRGYDAYASHLTDKSLLETATTWVVVSKEIDRLYNKIIGTKSEDWAGCKNDAQRLEAYIQDFKNALDTLGILY